MPVLYLRRESCGHHRPHSKTKTNQANRKATSTTQVDSMTGVSGMGTIDASVILVGDC